MFNDFKSLSFNTAKQKIMLLKSIYDRLNLSSLEERLNSLEIKTSDTYVKSINLKTYIDTFGTLPICPQTVDPILPDLSIDNVVKTYTTYYIKFLITIKNGGELPSIATSMNIIISGNLSTTKSIPALIGGASYTTTYNFPIDSSATGTEHKTFLVEVNPSHNFEEFSFSNNSYTELFETKITLPPEEYAHVIVHCHNPEGKEICGIRYANSGDGGLSGTAISLENSAYVVFYKNNQEVIDIPGAKDISEHGMSYILPTYGSGFKAIAYFNGISVIQDNLTLNKNTTTSLEFIFPRTILDIDAAGLTLEESDSKWPLPYSGTNYSVYGFSRTNYLGAEAVINSFAFQAYPEAAFYSIHSKLSSMLFETDISAEWRREFPLYDGVYLLYSSTAIHIPVSITPTSAFNYWFGESATQGNYPALMPSGIVNGMISRGMGGTTPVFTCGYFSAHTPPTYFSGSLANQLPRIISHKEPVTASISGEAILGGIKISSVPYDLIGSSF